MPPFPLLGVSRGPPVGDVTSPGTSTSVRTSPLITMLFGALACICAAGAIPAYAWAAATCSRTYSYAGMTASSPSHGISAVLSPIATPDVRKGHVAGWVGVGGDGFGPDGSSEWIQVGLSAFPGSGSSIYYEVQQPDIGANYVEVQANIAPGERHRVAVLEVHGRPSVWRVWLDGRAVSPPYYLPGSHVGWKPQATAESWNNNANVCNNYAYSFSGISLAAAPGGGWHSLNSRGFEFEDAGYSMTRRSPTSFIAASRELLRRLNSAK